VIRARRFYQVLFISGVGFFAGMGITSVVAAYRNVDGSFPHPEQAALAFGLGWSAFILLEVWCAILSFRDQLVLEPGGLMHRGIVRRRAIRFDEITRLTWRGRGESAGVVLHTANKRETFSFYLYAGDDRRIIIDCLRCFVSANVQDGWQEFLEAQTRAGQPPPKSAVTALVCLLIIAATGSAFVASWHYGVGNQWLLERIHG